MRVAVCFYGNMRSWDWVKKNNLEFFGKEVDYFVYTTDKIQKEFRHNYDLKDTPELYDEFTGVQLEKDFEGYNLVDYTIADYEKNNKTLYGNGNAYKVPFFFEHVMHLKRKHEYANNFEYDIVVFTRTDLVYFAIDNTMDWTSLDITNEWIIGNYKYEFLADTFKDGHDYVYIGTNNTMEHLANLNQYKEYIDPLNHPELTPEELLRKYLWKYGIEIVPDNSIHSVGFNNMLRYELLPVEHEYDKEFFECLHYGKFDEIKEEYQRLRIHERKTYAIRSSYKK